MSRLTEIALVLLGGGFLGLILIVAVTYPVAFFIWLIASCAFALVIAAFIKAGQGPPPAI